jgi:hypothetical protein
MSKFTEYPQSDTIDKVVIRIGPKKKNINTQAPTDVPNLRVQSAYLSMVSDWGYSVNLLISVWWA